MLSASSGATNQKTYIGTFTTVRSENLTPCLDVKQLLIIMLANVLFLSFFHRADARKKNV
jgi:hypothetical protein